MPAGMVDGCWFLRSPQAHWIDQPRLLHLLVSFITYLGVDGASAATAFALFATELALCSRSSFLLDFEEGPVGMRAPGHAMALDASGTRVLLIVD